MPMTDEYGEQEIRGIAREEAKDVLTAVDPDGNEISFSGLLSMGLTRRQALHVIGLVAAGATIGTATTDAIVGEASASHGGGQIGTDSNPLADIHTELLNSGGPVSDGDGVERNIWVIENGASDPDAAEPEDIIFEKEV